MGPELGQAFFLTQPGFFSEASSWGDNCRLPLQKKAPHTSYHPETEF